MKKTLLLLTCLLLLNGSAQSMNLATIPQVNKLKKDRRKTVTKLLPRAALILALWQAWQVAQENKDKKIKATNMPSKIWRRTLRTFKGGRGISKREKWTHRILAAMVAMGLTYPWWPGEFDRGADGYRWPQWRD